ncbi:MAG: glutamate synthase, partial [Gammaproteobacteria bacterium]|nr:glutamate synthase [Gammaproteobacteria bacterium]NIV21707.1 glutamate synthase [Gammaproteobacteria bacterium]
QGIHPAMDYLTQQNRRNRGDAIPTEEAILATDKRVVILGGGDTGADCLGTAHRQRAFSVHQFEILPRPPKVKTGSSHEEGGERRWGVLTKGFRGENGRVRELHGVEVEWLPPETNGGRPVMRELPGTEFSQPVELVLLAMGFLGPVRPGLVDELGVAFNERGALQR